MENKNNFVKELLSAFEQNGMSEMLNDSSAEKLYLLYNSLVETNKITNLTAVTDQNGVILKHFLDSASISEYIPANSSVIDVGCGAGFPSLPIAIIREDVGVTSLDSTGKKINFVEGFANGAKLNNVNPTCARAEDFVLGNREKFDVCTSRAVARLNVLAELCIPFIKVGGLFVAMKSNKGNEEYAEAKAGIEKLGAKLLASKKIVLNYSGEEIEREIYVFEKVKQTPKEFPRKYAQILKRPL